MQIHLTHFERASSAYLRIVETQLSTSEAIRYHRFMRKERARQFLIGRGLLRQMLAPHVGLAPHHIPLLEQTNQAPRLMLEHPETLNFSISHSREWVACCVSTEGKIGLDIEVIDAEREIMELAERSLAPSQVLIMTGLSEVERIAYFYQCWTAQEAKVKLGVPCQDLQHIRHSQLAIALCSDRGFTSSPELIVVNLE